jgi:hypothetical protein
MPHNSLTNRQEVDWMNDPRHEYVCTAAGMLTTANSLRPGSPRDVQLVKF